MGNSLHRYFQLASIISKTDRLLSFLTFYTRILLVGLTLPAAAQTPNQQQITASYIYNFAKNIGWPENDERTSFNILLLRNDDRALFDALRYLKTNSTIHGKPINVSQATSTKALDKFQLIFTKQNDPNVINSIYDKIDGKPSLLVTWQLDNKQLVMINLTPTADNLLKFEVNKSNIINQGLTPYPELILNGGSEIDVAKLYREGQASLVRLTKQLEAREKTLSELSSNITKQEKYNRDLENSLKSLSEKIHDSNALISAQSNQLASQKREIDLGIQLQEKLKLEVDDRSRALKENRTKLSEIQDAISLRESKLISLNERIRWQEEEIEKQKDTIFDLDEVVSTQGKALAYLRIMAILAILLIISIFVAYKTKRKDNSRLRAKGQDLQMATERLSVAKQKAEEANQAKGEFLSLMSHELRTPLQSIIGYTDVVIEEMRAGAEQRHVEDLQRVINNSERLLRLINGVLDIAKNESGGMQLTLIETRLSTLVSEAVDSVRPQIEKSNNTLATDISEIRAPAFIDPEKLLQIIINLLSNAAKFCENGQICLEAKHTENAIMIRVSDTGIGMSKEQQTRIFEKFCQADSSTTRKFQGSGLGLTITRQFCELMGGTIDVTSEKSVGASFSINIPLPIKKIENMQ